jgi:hypothetical protein
MPLLKKKRSDMVRESKVYFSVEPGESQLAATVDYVGADPANFRETRCPNGEYLRHTGRFPAWGGAGRKTSSLLETVSQYRKHRAGRPFCHFDRREKSWFRPEGEI